ncbi:MAG: c-type cytochrome [Ignavibacteriaceae bacterium]|nr:c-type cytochrome [Ignavibacteriaceae bacterium]NUM69755.1 c-type cytochrome [Ignavibacteriaceae bacterium]
MLKLKKILSGTQFRLNLIAMLLFGFMTAFAADESAAMEYITTGFYFFFGYLLLMTIIFLLGHNKKPEEEASLIKKFSQKLTDAKPIEQESEIMFSHEFDGIRELDNSLPPWWKYLFYVTIVFSVVYMVYYHVLSGPSSDEEYRREVRQAELDMAAYMQSGNVVVTEDNVTLLTDASSLNAGKDIFVKNCASCHANDGGGLVGPNLTDEYWIHGGGIKDVFKVVVNGVLDKGMLAWKSQLTSKQIQDVSSYVLSLQGTKPANPKAPQGEIWVDPAKAQAKADSTKKS